MRDPHCLHVVEGWNPINYEDCKPSSETVGSPQSGSAESGDGGEVVVGGDGGGVGNGMRIGIGERRAIVMDLRKKIRAREHKVE